MTRDDIIRMAKEAGLTLSSFCRWSAYSDDLERFAAFVAAAEREKIAAWMDFNHYTTGHGDCIENLLEEIKAQVAEDERWKCAEVAEVYEPRCDVCSKGVAVAILARGEA